MTIKIPSPRTIVTFAKTPSGKAVRGSRYTAYHWDRTYREFKRRFPHAEVYIMQGSYNLGVRLSAGTHDRDGVLDVWVTGIGWREAEQFFREEGWYGWWRHTGSWAATSKFHIHMITPHTPNAVGSLIPSQIKGYLANRLGLARSADGPDPAPHPKHVRAFNYDAWARQVEEEHMNNVQRADDKLQSAIPLIRGAIADLQKVPTSRPLVRARIAGLKTALATLVAAEKFLVK